MKKLVKAGLMFFLIMTMMLTCFAAEKVSILVNGSPIQLEDPLVTQNGKVYITLRDIGNALNFEFSWSGDKKTANLKNDHVIIAVQPGNRWYSNKTRDGKVENYRFSEGDEPIIVNDKLYVPVGNFAIVAGGSVIWDSKNNRFNIIYGSQLTYQKDLSARIYAGTGKRGSEDGTREKSSLHYAQSIYMTDDKELYIADSGILRKVSKDVTQTLKMEPNNVKLAVLRGYKNDVYALSTSYLSTDQGKVVSLYKVEGNDLKEVLTQRIDKTKFIDFCLISANEVCLLKDNLETNKRMVEIFNRQTGKVTTSVAVDEKFNAMTASKDTIYLANSVEGTIYSYDLETKTLELFAGQADTHQFIDGKTPLFGQPKMLKYANNSLYVIDYNLVRKISLSSTGALEKCETAAGKATALINAQMGTGKASELILSTVNPIDIAVNGNSLYITDANQFKIMEIK